MLSLRQLTLIGCLVLITSFGCGKQRQTTGFDHYIENFERASSHYGPQIRVRDLIVELVPLPSPNTIAECIQQTWSTPRIRIDTRKWERMSDNMRSLVLFHEMGHCVLDRRHDSRVLEDGTPASIMHPYNIPEQLFTTRREYYLEELFTNAPKRSDNTEHPTEHTCVLYDAPAHLFK